MERSNDQIRKITLFHIGDKVLVRRDYAKNSFSTKLDDKWDGPYYIEEPIGQTTYYLHDGLKKLKNPVHASRMKFYYPRKPLEFCDSHSESGAFSYRSITTQVRNLQRGMK